MDGDRGAMGVAMSISGSMGFGDSDGFHKSSAPLPQAEAEGG